MPGMASQPATRHDPTGAQPSWPALATLVALGAVVRLPFWVEALRLPIDGDTAIVGLMARHGLFSATFWGQPYGSPLDAWLAAPFVALLGPTPLAVRLPCFLLSLALVPLGWALARRLHPAAAAPAAFLLACPPAYLLLLSALPPPVYPVTLPLLGLLLLGALRLGRQQATATGNQESAIGGSGTAERSGAPQFNEDRTWRGGPSSRARPSPHSVSASPLERSFAPRGTTLGLGLILWGLLAGLALWTHLVALVVVLPALAHLAWPARRSRADLARILLTTLPALLFASAPWWTRLAWDPSATAVVSLGDDSAATWRHLRALLPRLHEPLLGLLGAHTPTTADDPVNHVGLPAGATAALALLYATGLLRAAQVARRAARGGSPTGRRVAAVAALLGAALALTLLAFPWPLRAGPETLRFLTPAYLPLAVLVAWAPAAEGHRRGAWVLVLALGLLHLVPATRLLGAWRAAGPERPLLPDCRPVLRLLDERGLRRVWASYDTAWCLTYLSGERVIASQPWNERFPGAALRYRDEVRFARAVAWVLVPGADFDLPRPERFEPGLRASGGAFRRTAVGQALVYDRFVPPFPAQGRPLPGTGAAGDGDLATRTVEPGRGPTTLRLDAHAPLSAVTLVGGLEPPGLPVGLTLEISADGVAFERVGRLRPGRAATALVWANGQPMARDGLEVVSLPLHGRSVAALRLTPTPEQGPWSLAEVLLHAPAPPAAWSDDAPLAATSWTQRRQRLLAEPRARDAGWQFRVWLANRSLR